jgi:excisionase family DNA binding protein
MFLSGERRARQGQPAQEHLPVTDAPTAPAPEPVTGTATYTIADIARLTQSSERHIGRLHAQGKIPGRIPDLGRVVRFSKSAVDAWLAGQAVTGGKAS